MDNGKRFYWIKLKTNFFSREDIDFLLSQKNGCQYVVLYQMLCLNTANTNGEMISVLNEVIVPYDVNKIVRDTKYFDFDTVTVALELFKKLGLIYQEENGNLRITDLINMVGSESANRDAIKKREYRLNKKRKELEKDNLEDILGTKCLIEYRDKSIEYRDKSIEDINSVSVNDAEASHENLTDFFKTFDVKDTQVQNEIIYYLNNGMDLEVIKKGLLLPYERNVANFDFENEEAPIKKPNEYGLSVIKNWFNFGVRTLNDMKKYNKLNKGQEVMLGSKGGGKDDNRWVI